MWQWNVIVIQVLKHPTIQISQISVPLAEFINNSQTQGRVPSSASQGTEKLSCTAFVQAKVQVKSVKHTVWLPGEKSVVEIHSLHMAMDWAGLPRSGQWRGVSGSWNSVRALHSSWRSWFLSNLVSCLFMFYLFRYMSCVPKWGAILPFTFTGRLKHCSKSFMSRCDEM